MQKTRNTVATYSLYYIFLIKRLKLCSIIYFMCYAIGYVHLLILLTQFNFLIMHRDLKDAISVC